MMGAVCAWVAGGFWVAGGGGEVEVEGAVRGTCCVVGGLEGACGAGCAGSCWSFDDCASEKLTHKAANKTAMTTERVRNEPRELICAYVEYSGLGERPHQPRMFTDCADKCSAVSSQ